MRRRDIHRRLVRFQGQNRILDRNGIALGDENLDDFDMVEIADVRY